MKKYFKLIIVLVFFILLFMSPTIVNICISKNSYNAFVNQIENLLNSYESYSNYEIIDNATLTIKINMDENFQDKTFEDKEKFIQETNNSLNTFFEEYKKVMLSIDREKYSGKTCNIEIYSKEDCYTLDKNLDNAIMLNGKTYTKHNYIKSLIAKKINDTSYNTYLDNITSLDTLINISNIEDINTCTNEIIYYNATQEYENGDFKEALTNFSKIASYKDSNTKISELQILNQFQGEWEEDTVFSLKDIVIISGWDIYYLLNAPLLGPEYTAYVYTYVLDGNTLKMSLKPLTNPTPAHKNLYIKDNKLICPVEQEEGYYMIPTSNYIKTSDNPVPPQLITQEAPKIGMTKEEVENSTWGKPSKINRTTTAYGVHEQWVYSNYRYIYFDNDIVTAIQD